MINPDKEQIMMAGQPYAVPALITLDDAQTVTRFIPARRGKDDLPAYLAKLTPDDDFVWIDHCRNVEALFGASQPGGTAKGLCLAAGSLNGRVASQRLNNEKLRLSHAQIIKRLDRTDTADAVTQQRRQARLENFQRTGSWYTREVAWSGWQSDVPLTLRSAGFGSGASQIHYRQRGLQNAASLQRGISLVGVSPGTQPELLAHVDTCQAGTPSPAMADKMDARREDYAGFAVLVHDTAFCDDQQALNAALDGTKLEQWRHLEFRQPYIGVISAQGETAEITGAAGAAASMVIKP